ncbi:MAG: Rpp14/Pop5 family protein [archaeon]
MKWSSTVETVDAIAVIFINFIMFPSFARRGYGNAEVFFLRIKTVMKTKPLMPSLKEKKRYLVYEVLSDSDLSQYDIFTAIKESIDKTLGMINCAKAGCMILAETFTPKTKRGIIKVNVKHTDELRLALSLIKEINKKEVIVRSVACSGIIKKAKVNL